MRLSDQLITADERGDRDALRSIERRVPARPVLGALDGLTLLILVLGGDSVPDELLAGYRMLPFGQAIELIVPDASTKAPLGGQFALPLAPHGVVLRVVPLLGVHELTLVIAANLGGVERGFR